MNTNPHATTILCYGDSNTFGQKADGSRGRHAADVRWTGRLQKLLGDDYYVIEEGLSSRTTDLEYARKPGRNGKTFLFPCLQSHNPIDVVLLMLGTNDLKTEYGRTPAEVATATSGLLDDIKQFGKNSAGDPPQVILLSPIHIDHTAPLFLGSFYDAVSAARSLQLAAVLEELATAQACRFVDASQVATPGEDGIHLTPDSHQKLAEKLAHVITNG